MDHDIHSNYPYLFQFMGAYFYQSALEFADSEEAVIDDFLTADGAPWYVCGLWSDIHRFVDLHPETVLNDFNAILKPDYIIGSTDKEAHEWLLQLANKCASHLLELVRSEKLFQK
jgi:hypothetical protein